MSKNVKWTPEVTKEYYRQHGSAIGKGGANCLIAGWEDELILTSGVNGELSDAEIADKLKRSLRAIHVRRSKLKLGMLRKRG